MTNLILLLPTDLKHWTEVCFNSWNQQILGFYFGYRPRWGSEKASCLPKHPFGPVWTLTLMSADRLKKIVDYVYVTLLWYYIAHLKTHLRLHSLFRRWWWNLPWNGATCLLTRWWSNVGFSMWLKDPSAQTVILKTQPFVNGLGGLQTADNGVHAVGSIMGPI